MGTMSTNVRELTLAPGPYKEFPAQNQNRPNFKFQNSDHIYPEKNVETIRAGDDRFKAVTMNSDFSWNFCTKIPGEFMDIYKDSD